MEQVIDFTIGFSENVAWPWPIAVYLFLAGISGGAFAAAALVRIFRKQTQITPLFQAASGARPAAMAAQGEIPIGLSAAAFLKPFLKYKTPVTVVQPEEGIAWDAEACALPRGCPHPQEAKAFLDFCASPAVGEIAAAFSGVAAREGFSTEEGKRIAERFLPMDFARAARDKEAMLTRWHALATR